jgi:osmotically inducible lipoprotein OsmB
MRAKLALAVVAVSSLTLGACGETPGCRALTGAGVGAAGGAAIGALAGNPVAGAAAGAAVVGAATSPDQVNGPSPCY